MVIDKENDTIYMDPATGYAMLKSLASWLEALPESAQLQDKEGHVFVVDPHVCSQLVRFVCPAEGRA